MAAAKVTGVHAAVGAVLSEPDGFFTIERTEGFSQRFRFTADWLWQELRCDGANDTCRRKYCQPCADTNRTHPITFQVFFFS